jgi:hypothetical protein
MTKKIEIRSTDNMPGGYPYLVGWLSEERRRERRITPASWNHAVEMAERFSAEEARELARRGVEL